MNIKNLRNIVKKTNIILNYKQFEAIKFGNWYQPFFNISFLYDSYGNIGYIKLGIKNQDKQIGTIEMRSLGKAINKNQYNQYKLIFPQDISLDSEFDFTFFIEDLIDLLNLNKLNIVYKIDSIKNEKNLLPSAIFSSDKPFSFNDFEKIVYSLKEVNYMIKDFWLKNVR